MGTCSLDNTPAGVPVGGQVPGDCKQIVCDGQGGFSTAVDDTDVPDDGNDCTADVCSNGIGSNTPFAAGTPCNGGIGTCDENGFCQQ
jgi:hypothetical protein